MDSRATTIDLVPVTVIGGYLGAGKTTLLNRLLAGDHGRRIAVLVNDFGAVNIDAELIASRNGDTVSLQNGCICCSIADALGDALDRVLAFDPQPDQIVIEASGVADPAKVANYGRGWPGCRLDAVIVLADAESIRRQAQDEFVGELVLRQLGSGDIVVLTKADLVTPETLEEVRLWVRDRIGDTAALLATSHGRVDDRVLLGAGRFDRRDRTPQVGADVDHWLSTATIELDAPVERSALERALDEWPDTILRVKGFVDLDDGGCAATVVVQRVGRRWSIEPWPADRELPDGRRLVLIGIENAVFDVAVRQSAAWPARSRRS